MSHPARNLKRGLIVASLVLLLFLLTVPLAVQTNAAFDGCEGDPIVLLSNGDVLQMTVAIATDASHVTHIVYTVHAPDGVNLVKVFYTKGPLMDKETVQFLNDGAPDQYTTDTVVSGTVSGARVLARTKLFSNGKTSATASGYIGDTLSATVAW